MEPRFEIRPYIGVGALKFGMTTGDVRAVLGPAMRSVRGRTGGTEEYREGLKVCYAPSPETATDFVLFPSALAVYNGIDLFQSPDLLSVLMNEDAHPLEGMGIVVFLKLGLAVTGFGETKDSDRTITAFAEGRWDALRHQLTVYRPGR